MKGVLPQRMSSKEFDEIAVAIEDRATPGRWSVYVGHHVVGTCEADDEQQAIGRVHKNAVVESLSSSGAGTDEVGTACSAGAICSYPDIIQAFPERACEVIKMERGPLGRLTAERRAISSLLWILDALREEAGMQGAQDLWLAARPTMEAARRTLTEVPPESRELILERCLRDLIEARDTKAPDNDLVWEKARSFVEAGGKETFGTWAAAVYVMCAQDVMTSTAWKAMFEAGMTPSEAVMHSATRGSSQKH